ncbi:MAG TPA: signal peptidase I [Kofleriaceae bacterium]|jgi:signal peptidase I|nr:signal peptidase I [Polyangiales bacterium]
MRASLLDFRVRREARGLVREARAALALKRGLRGKGGDLETVTDSMDKALASSGDPAARDRIRRQLPVLDALADELIRRPSKSTMRDYIESIGAAILIALALRAFVVEAFKIPSSSMYPTLEIGDHIFVNKFIYGVRIPWTTTKLFELRGPHPGEVIVFIYPCDPDRDYIKRVIATAGQTVETRCGVLYIDGVAHPDTYVDQETYRDYDEDRDVWYTDLTTVNRYHEKLGDHAFSVFGSPSRDDREPRNFPHDARVSQGNGQCQGPQPKTPQVFGHIEPDATHIDDKCDKPQLHYVVPPGHIFAMGDNRDNSNDGRVWGSVPLDNVKGKALFIWLSYGQLDKKDWKDWIRFTRVGNFVD